MKKMVITLVIASLYAGHAFAETPAAELGNAARQAVKAGDAAGVIKFGAGASKELKPGALPGVSPGATAGTAAVITGKGQATAKQEDYTQSSCKVDSAMSDVSPGELPVFREAFIGGLSGNQCIEKLQKGSKAITVVLAMNKAGLVELKRQGADEISKLGVDQQDQVINAELDAIAANLHLGNTPEEGRKLARERAADTCANNCDFFGPTACGRLQASAR